ncbi:MAG: NAD(P)-dependent oxidoreductase [Clostridium sp.]
MNIVVTGATSFVGTETVKELLRRGHHVYAVLRTHSAKSDQLLEQGKIPSGLTILEEDLGTLDHLTTRIHEVCDVFLHMGWRGAGSDSRRDRSVQAESVRDAMCAADTAKALGCKRFLFTGSQAEYGIHDAGMTEETDCRPTSPYGEAKLQVRYRAEERCRALDLDYGHIRIFSTYGPGDHPWSLISSCIRTFEEEGCMELSDCTQMWNFMEIEDAARGIADLAEYRGKLGDFGCVYNLAGPMEETGPLRGFVEKVHELCGSRGTLRYGVHPANAEGTVNLIPDIQKMAEVTGWTPKISFEQGILKILRKL